MPHDPLADWMDDGPRGPAPGAPHGAPRPRAASSWDPVDAWDAWDAGSHVEDEWEEAASRRDGEPRVRRGGSPGGPAPLVAWDGEGEPRRSAPPRIWVMAAAAWLAAVGAGAALVLGNGAAEADLTEGGVSAPAPAATGPVPDAGPTEAMGDPSPPEAADAPAAAPPTPARVPIGAPSLDDAVPSRLAALAAVAVRTSVTRDAPEATRYVDLVAAESWDLHGDIAVVTVRVVLLEGTEGRWTSVHAARYAVPLSVGALRPAGEPWRLPADPTGDDLPEPVPLDPAEALDPERARALGSAVEAVGYRQVSVEAAGLGPGDLVVVRLRGIAPGEEAESDHHLWLDPTGARVLGSP